MSAWNMGYDEAKNEGSIYNNPFDRNESTWGQWKAGYEARIVEETESMGY